MLDGDIMTIFKMPRMKKSEYDMLITEECICLIAFAGDSHPTLHLLFTYSMEIHVFSFHKIWEKD